MLFTTFFSLISICCDRAKIGVWLMLINNTSRHKIYFLNLKNQSRWCHISKPIKALGRRPPVMFILCVYYQNVATGHAIFRLQWLSRSDTETHEWHPFGLTSRLTPRWFPWMLISSSAFGCRVNRILRIAWNLEKVN